MNTRRATAVAIAALAMVLAGCGSSSKASSGSSTTSGSSSASSGAKVSSTLLAQAKQEGSLNLDWSTLDITGEVAQWSALFQQMYGFSPNVKLTPSVSQPTNEAHLAQEYAAGQKTTQDVFLGTETTFLPLLHANILQTLDPSQLPALAGKVQANNTSLPIETRITGIEYNSNEVKDPPTTMTHALQDAESGKFVIVSTPFAAGFPYLAASQFLGPQKALAYVQTLGKHIKGTAFCGSVYPRVASGEFNLYVLDCGITEALEAQQKGLPVKYVVPTDLPMIGYYYIGVPKNATHPAMAQLWTNMMATRQAQDILYKLDLADNATFPGSHTAALVSQIESQEHITFTVASIAWAEQNPQVYDQTLNSEMQKAIQGQG